MSVYRRSPTPPIERPSPPEPAKGGSPIPSSARRTLSARWCRAIPSLRESALRVAFMRSELDRARSMRVARALDDLCGRAEQADPLAREVLSAVTPLFADPSLEARVDELRAMAAEGALLPLARFLRKKTALPDAPPLSASAEARLLATSSSGRVLTLGERKALARKPSRASFEKLLRDPHPAVVRNLLANPLLTESDVIQLAARRPAFREVLVEIAKSPAWAGRPRVRMALVQNPGTPPAVAVPLVGLLIRPELREILAAADVQKVVRAAATELLGRRPPVPPKGASRGPVQ